MKFKFLKSHIFICFFNLIIALAGAQIMGTSVVNAAPWIDLGYGNSQGKATWAVDRGSLTAGGKIPHPIILIKAVLSDEYSEWEEREYRFTEQEGVWKYMWTGYTGKHSYISSGGNWEKVSGNRLANDILYIATHH